MQMNMIFSLKKYKRDNLKAYRIENINKMKIIIALVLEWSNGLMARLDT